jgi:hypothetical protein
MTKPFHKFYVARGLKIVSDCFNFLKRSGSTYATCFNILSLHSVYLCFEWSFQSGLENRDYARRYQSRRPRDTPLSKKAGTNFADKWRWLGRHSSLVD